mmetsp:Transcript_17943/g.28643  ORF Transcript_17943/g.28643 Transcript_17943/m.28643 type:complete len:204 (+) Transcript_17943:309-920(+)
MPVCGSRLTAPLVIALLRLYICVYVRRKVWRTESTLPGLLMLSIVSEIWKFSIITATKRLLAIRLAKINHTIMRAAPANCERICSAGKTCIEAYNTPDHESPVKSWNIVRAAKEKVPKFERDTSSMSEPNIYLPATTKQRPTKTMKTMTLHSACTLLTADCSIACSVGKYFINLYPRIADSTLNSGMPPKTPTNVITITTASN